MNSVGGGGFMSGGGRSGGGYSSGSQLTNFHSVFAGGDATTPPLLDPSEFPSLTNRGDSMPQPSASMPGKQPYGIFIFIFFYKKIIIFDATFFFYLWFYDVEYDS